LKGKCLRKKEIKGKDDEGKDIRRFSRARHPGSCHESHRVNYLNIKVAEGFLQTNRTA